MKTVRVYDEDHEYMKKILFSSGKEQLMADVVRLLINFFEEHGEAVRRMEAKR